MADTDAQEAQETESLLLSPLPSSADNITTTTVPEEIRIHTPLPAPVPVSVPTPTVTESEPPTTLPPLIDAHSDSGETDPTLETPVFEHAALPVRIPIEVIESKPDDQGVRVHAPTPRKPSSARGRSMSLGSQSAHANLNRFDALRPLVQQEWDSNSADEFDLF